MDYKSQLAPGQNAPQYIPPQPQYPPIQQPGYAPVHQQPGYSTPQQYAPSGAIVQQPGTAGDQWMKISGAPPSGCPPGLEYLTQIDQLIVKQQIEVLEIVSGCETNNKYEVQNSLGQNVYFAVEDTACCTRQCCGPLRPFDMNIFDNANNEVMHLMRPCRCVGCCFGCCLQEIEVHSPPGTIIGYVLQKWTICTPTCSPMFQICDALKNPILLIAGPCCVCGCCRDIEFKVLALDGVTEVGKISKQWMGIIKEAVTDADTFGISFPMDLDIKAKATMLAAAFLIDFIYFESAGNHNRR